MKRKVSELTGALLDSAVAKANGQAFEILPREVWGDGLVTIVGSAPVCKVGFNYFKPSTRWEDGGSVIDRMESIDRDRYTGVVTACMEHPARADGVQRSWGAGATVLEACCRCLVASVFGDEVDLP